MTSWQLFNELGLIKHNDFGHISDHDRRESQEVYGREPDDTTRSVRPQDVCETESMKAAENRADNLIRTAEAAKTKLIPVPGKDKLDSQPWKQMEGQVNQLNSGNFFHSAMVDETFQFVAAHVDENIRNKVVQGKYVDFAILLPKDQISHAEDGRMELINKDGHTYFVPVSERENNGTISNFSHWEQTFRVFSEKFTPDTIQNRHLNSSSITI